MAIDKSVNQAPKLSGVVDTEETLPDVEVIIEEDGGDRSDGRHGGGGGQK